MLFSTPNKDEIQFKNLIYLLDNCESSRRECLFGRSLKIYLFIYLIIRTVYPYNPRFTTFRVKSSISVLDNSLGSALLIGCDHVAA